MSVNCHQCDGKCCRYFCFEIDAPDDFDEFEDIRWFLLHEHVSVHIDEEDDWYIQIDNRCRKLVTTLEGERCGDYENRPTICRKFSPHECDFVGGDYGYKALFKCAEDIEKYARETLGEKAWKKGTEKRNAIGMPKPPKKKKTKKKKKA